MPYADELFEVFEHIEALTAEDDPETRKELLTESCAYFGKKWELTLTNAATKRVNTIQHRVILVHGIRTNAPWYETVRQVFSTNPLLKVVTPGYGTLHLLPFLIPPFRRKPFKILEDEIVDNYGRDMVTSVVAHSFGAYLVNKVLIKNPDIRLYRLVMCGSVTSAANFSKIRNKPHAIVNDIGMRDVFPVLANAFVYGVGSSGYFGLRSGEVVDRFHDRKHDFGSEEFIRTWWLPFLSTGFVDHSIDTRTQTRPKRHWFMGLINAIGDYKLIRYTMMLMIPTVLSFNFFT